jgi:hypothetical protein
MIINVVSILSINEVLGIVGDAESLIGISRESYGRG